MRRTDNIGGLGGGHPPEDSLGHLDQHDLQPQLRRHGGSLQSDVSATHDKDARISRKKRLHPVDICQRTHSEDMLQVSADRRRQPVRHRPGGQRQLVIGNRLPAQGQYLRGGVQMRDRLTQLQVNALLHIDRLRPQVEPLARHVAHEIGFRKRRALIGRVGLGADQRERSLEPLGSQGFGQRGTRLTRSDDDNSAHCLFPLASRSCRLISTGSQRQTNRKERIWQW